MAFELRLTFFGLTGLVPNKKAGTPGDPKEWLVVLPALANGTVVKFEKGQMPALPLRVDEEIPIAPHQAVLVANEQAVRKESTKKPRFRFLDPRPIPNKDPNEPPKIPTDAESDLLFHLDREVVKIEDLPDPDERVKPWRFTGTWEDPKLPNVSNPDQLHDIKWLPQINDCLPHLSGGVPLDRNLFKPGTVHPAGDHPFPLAAVVRLDRGILETSHVHLKKAEQAGQPDEPVPYEFHRLSGGLLFEQALASSFRLRVRVEQATAKLELKNKDGDPQSLVVGPYKDCPKEGGVDVVEVKVYNRELEEILGFGSDSAQQRGRADLDFLVFYQMSSVWSTLKAADLVAPQLGGKGGGGRSKPCEPPTYPGLS